MSAGIRRALPAALLVSAGIGLLLIASSLAQQDRPSSGSPSLTVLHSGAYPMDAAGSPSSHSAYAEQVRAFYDFSFGQNDISLPGNGQIEGNDFVPATVFPDAQYCGHCHQEAYHEWRQALHSNSFRTPFYRNSVNLLIRDPSRGIRFTRHCDSCHNPIAVVSGALTAKANMDRSFDLNGVTCSVCHSIQHLQSTYGNGGYVLGVPAVMVDEKGNRMPGIVPDKEILTHLDRHSKAVMQDFYHTSEFCSACHKANLPVPLNDYKWIRAFTTYDDWQNSKFSQRNPLTFYTADLTTCQSCHMKREPAALPDYGAQNGTLASHRWLAGNTAVPFYYGLDEQLAKTIEFLKSGNFLNVDIFALKPLDSDSMIAPLGLVSYTVLPNQIVQAYVVVQNKNIGHSLIPEVRDLYEAWVEFSVKDRAGKEIYHSGFLNPDGTLDRRAHSFTNRPVNIDGDFVDNHKVWTIHSMAYDNTVQAGRSALIRYQFRIPANARGPLTVTARVNYRHFRQSYLNNVFGNDHPAYPLVELASETRTVNLGFNKPAAPSAGENPEWMRWNNLGIGYLDEQQYPQAIEAFNHVIRLRPTYKDGYINAALTYIAWEKYSSARAPLFEALALKPHDARALFYLGLVEKREAHPQAEIADLLDVIGQYPDSRDARRELGIAYYQQNQNDLAMQQFQALQKIDPDDLAAHYNLAILYRREGMKQEASREQALFAAKRIDPGAPTYSLDFLRRHPEISIESSPWHLHTDLVEGAPGSIDKP